MKTSPIGKVKYFISQMMNNENDEHAELLCDIKERVDTNKYNINHLLSNIMNKYV